MKNIPYNTTQYDIGNGYDAVNYKYVVPVAGTYFFGGSWFKSSSTHSRLSKKWSNRKKK